MRGRQSNHRPGGWVRGTDAALRFLLAGLCTIELTLMPATPNPGEAISPELEEFIFSPDQFKTEDIPRELQPELIAKYVQVRITPATPLAPLRQLEKVVNRYDVTEAAEHLLKFLDERETTPEAVQHSAVLCRIVARLGTPAQRKQVQDYSANRLVERANSVAALTELVSLQEALGVVETPVALQQRLESGLNRVSPLAESNAQARQEAQALERLKNIALPRARMANAIKAKILQIPDRPQRLSELAQTYLGIKHGYGEYLPAWAAARLRREIWADQPDQQLERRLNLVRRREVVAAFRSALPMIRQVPQLTETEQDFMRVSALRAVRFFGGELSEDELMFVAQKGEGYETILAD